MRNNFILITAAKNEELLIENTIKSVISQTVKPVHWYIVSDNSTDKTDEIIEKYTKNYKFIKLIRKSDQIERDFASKVHALNLALERVTDKDYDFIGILDADITFNIDYYESMLKEFKLNIKLGIAGGEFFDIVDGKKFRVMKSSSSVRGGIQLFRKECFEQIKNFTPMKQGGEDVIVEVLARKNGWIVKSFDHQMLEHHRLTGTGGWGILEAKFREGMLSYNIGYHPLFQILKSIHRFKERPYIISGILHLFGFIYANILREKRTLPNGFVEFLRTEQMNRIKNFSF